MKIELGYKTIVISISAMLGILSSSTTLSGTVDNISIKGISLGDDIKAVVSKMEADFPNFKSYNGGTRKCLEPDPQKEMM